MRGDISIFRKIRRINQKKNLNTGPVWLWQLHMVSSNNNNNKSISLVFWAILYIRIDLKKMELVE